MIYDFVMKTCVRVVNWIRITICRNGFDRFSFHCPSIQHMSSWLFCVCQSSFSSLGVGNVEVENISRFPLSIQFVLSICLDIRKILDNAIVFVNSMCHVYYTKKAMEIYGQWDGKATPMTMVQKLSHVIDI